MALNLGILAHVDAGKTTLTERLLYAAGVIDQPGSVDAGTTQTDTLALERQRGITIKSAVASFGVGDLTINLIDTPGHPDFIAEVERVLSVLDGAVLVISAVEGVQPQTRILMRSLERLGIPTLLFVNKIDRAGADPDRVLAQIRDRLQLAAIPLTSVHAAGTRRASVVGVAAEGGHPAVGLMELLAERDDDLLAAYVAGHDQVTAGRLRAALAAQTSQGLIHPVFFGSAVTGAGVAELTEGITELLPIAGGNPAGPVAGAIFKIERSVSGERVAYIRMVSGTIHLRDKLSFGPDLEGKVTAIAVFDRGPATAQRAIVAGQIGKLWGLSEVQIGDPIGEQKPGETARQFPPPTLESVVTAREAADRGELHVALTQLAEQDPLINVRQDDERHEILVSLYGEVQKEVIQATLADDYGIDVTFSDTTTIYVERPAGTGSAIEVLQSDNHPYSATIGLTVEPGPADSGLSFRLDIDPRTIPLHIYKTAGRFTESMKQYVLGALASGRHGWRITDIVVTMTRCGFYVGDGPAKQVLATPKTSAIDFRKLTPLVLAQALEQAGTVVCQPMTRGELEIPADRLGATLSALARLGATVDAPLPRGDLMIIEVELPSASVQVLRQQLPGLAGGEGVLQTSFGGYQPVPINVAMR
ncbi:MAG: TetM/TetW/TetO/TetS family tetracycline resistance ribosomal protection protein [Actinobacteria bacterium]|nr:TetM/TetW/TetO/TetS family tetracycline resistance ribosomal protection protein [Actinomycetota bacterium]